MAERKISSLFDWMKDIHIRISFDWDWEEVAEVTFYVFCMTLLSIIMYLCFNYITSDPVLIGYVGRTEKYVSTDSTYNDKYLIKSVIKYGMDTDVFETKDKKEFFQKLEEYNAGKHVSPKMAKQLLGEDYKCPSK